MGQKKDSDLCRELYFAYGSNLNVSRMIKRCPGARGISAAVLEGWKVVERTFADIEKAEGECVHGALYAVTPEDLQALDYYEGYPEFYQRKKMLVTDAAGVFRKAWVYMMAPEYQKIQGGSYGKDYREICSAGAEEWMIPNVFIAAGNRKNTLFPGKIPEIAAGLAEVRNFLGSGEELPRAKKLWNGARVAIVTKKRDLCCRWGFYPEDLQAVTPHAWEVSWLFNDLKSLFLTAGLINSINKFAFYGELASAVTGATEKDPDISARDLCRALVSKAENIYKEMME